MGDVLLVDIQPKPETIPAELFSMEDVEQEVWPILQIDAEIAFTPLQCLESQNSCMILSGKRDSK